MSDFACHIRIKFSVFNKEFDSGDWYVNYFDNGDGIDQRIVDWFKEKYDEAYIEFCNQEDDRAAKVAQESEYNEYLRLRKKFEGEQNDQ